MNIPRLLVSAAGKSSGKTTFSTGLCAALYAQGTIVQPFKKGPDYIDPMWLSGASGRSCYNLDFNSQSPGEMREQFERRTGGADIAVVEGNKGLFDGVDVDGSDSNAALAHLLGLPVLLVIDAQGVTRGVAPLLNGYREFDHGIRYIGVILNKVAGTRHRQKLLDVIERYTDFDVLGVIPRSREMEMTERHLGLVPHGEDPGAQQRIGKFRDTILREVDLERVVDRAATISGAMSPVVPTTVVASAGGPAAKSMPTAGSATAPDRGDVTIAIARDSVFSFYYPDDLEALQTAGASLAFFDAVHDACMPDADGLFIGGGFPESRAAELGRNQSMLQSLRDFVTTDRPVYAECGGLMLLSRSLTWRATTTPMAGIIEADTVMSETPEGRGYVRLKPLAGHPWLGDLGELRAHEFHYSRLENLSPETRFGYDVTRGYGINGHSDGIVSGNLFASYTHLRNTQSLPWASRFVDYVRRHKLSRARQEQSTDGQKLSSDDVTTLAKA